MNKWEVTWFRKNRNLWIDQKVQTKMIEPLLKLRDMIEELVSRMNLKTKTKKNQCNLYDV